MSEDTIKYFDNRSYLTYRQLTALWPIPVVVDSQNHNEDSHCCKVSQFDVLLHH